MSVQEVRSATARAGENPPAILGGGSGAISLATWIVATASAAWMLVPLLIEYGEQLWTAEHYRFYPLLLGAVGWLAWRRSRSPDQNGSRQSGWVRGTLWCVAVLVLAAAALASSPFGAAVALLLLVAAALYEWRGTWAIRTYLPVAGVLLLILRPPFGWDQKMIVAMQRSATSWASGVLDLGGVRHLADGVVIRLPERDFFVDEACSGVHSLFATLAFVAVFAVATRRGALKSLLLFVAAVFWVLVANTLRVIAVVVLSTRYELPVLDGAGHETLGVLVFAFVIGLVLSTDRLLLFLFPQREQLLAVTAPAGFKRASAAAQGAAVRGRSFPLAIATLFVLIAAGVTMLPAQATPRSSSPFSLAQGLRPVPREALPATWNGWKQVAFQLREREKDDPAGEISRIWTYHKGRLVTAVSIDGPFDAWHDTEVCYHGLGYTTQSCDDVEVHDGSAVPAEFTELSMTSGSGQHGYVLFMAYDTNGQALRPPASRNASVARFVAAWRQRMAGEAPSDPLQGRVYQVQLFSENRLNFTAAEREELTHLFHHMRREIARNSSPSKQDSSPEGGAT